MSSIFPTQATYAGAASGSATAQSITLPNEVTLADILGVPITWVPSVANTGATTLEVNSGTATAIQKPTANGLIALVGGELQASQPVMTMYTGTAHVLLSRAGANSAIEVFLDGMGSAITTGNHGYVEVPFDCTILAWTVVSNANGLVCDIWRANAAFPTSSDSIVGSGNMPQSSGTTYERQAPSGWTSTALAAKDILIFNVTSSSVIEQCLISLTVTGAD